MSGHLTERAALLSRMEWSKSYRGSYLVEGYSVRRRSIRRPSHVWWEVKDGDGVLVANGYRTFTEALRWIAEKVNP